MNPTRRALAVLFAGTALAGATILPAAAAAAAPISPTAAISGCVFQLGSLRAVNLRHDGDVDHVFVRADDTWYPAGNDGVAFGLNQTRTASAFHLPTGGVGFDGSGLPVRVLTDDFPINHHIDHTVQCTAGTNQVLRFEDGDAVYDLTYTVTSAG